MKRLVSKNEIIIEQLRLENEQLLKCLKNQQLMFECTFDAIMILDNEMNFQLVNSATCQLFQLTKEQFMNRNLNEFLSPLSKDNLQKGINYSRERKSPYELVIQLDNGQLKFIEYTVNQHTFSESTLIIMRDISTTKILKEQLRKSDTLNVVGQLAAGIAHEIRNPMTSLKGFIQLLEASVKDDFSMYFDVITSELNRIESIITEFLVLAKPQSIQFLKKDICKIMKNTIELLNAQAILVNVKMNLYCEEHLPTIYCEPNQLKQVFINILKNAIEVMPKGGEVTVYIKRKNENEIMISITDEGCGIPKDKLKRLGEPFYTTKECGTGLGLMVSYKIIEEHFGEMEVESVEGEGTTFYITLPIQQSIS